MVIYGYKLILFQFVQFRLELFELFLFVLDCRLLVRCGFLYTVLRTLFFALQKSRGDLLAQRNAVKTVVETYQEEGRGNKRNG